MYEVKYGEMSVRVCVCVCVIETVKAKGGERNKENLEKHLRAFEDI